MRIDKNIINNYSITLLELQIFKESYEKAIICN